MGNTPRSTSSTKQFRTPATALWDVVSDPTEPLWRAYDIKIQALQGSGEVGTTWTELSKVQGEPTLVTQTVVESSRPIRFAIEDSVGRRTTWTLEERGRFARVTLWHRAPSMDRWADEMWPVIEATTKAELTAALANLEAAATRQASTSLSE